MRDPYYIPLQPLPTLPPRNTNICSTLFRAPPRTTWPGRLPTAAPLLPHRSGKPPTIQTSHHAPKSLSHQLVKKPPTVRSSHYAQVPQPPTGQNSLGGAAPRGPLSDPGNGSPTGPSHRPGRARNPAPQKSAPNHVILGYVGGPVGRMPEVLFPWSRDASAGWERPLTTLNCRKNPSPQATNWPK